MRAGGRGIVVALVGLAVAAGVALFGGSSEPVTRPARRRAPRRREPESIATPEGWIGLRPRDMTPELEAKVRELLAGTPGEPGTWDYFPVGLESETPGTTLHPSETPKEYAAAWSLHDGAPTVTLYRRAPPEEKLKVIPLPDPPR